MSKKDYIAIANAIKDTNKYIKETVSKDYQQVQLNAVLKVQELLTVVFRIDNNNFDTARFYTYVEDIEKRYKDFTDK